jgi:hypothetical protein
MRTSTILVLLLGCSGSGTNVDPPPPSTGFGSTGSHGTVGGTTGFEGTTGSTSGFFGYGTATLSNSDGFAFTPKATLVADAAQHASVERAQVSINFSSPTCGPDPQENVTLSFGTEGTALTAGSYLVDGGATIVWSPGSGAQAASLTAVQGLVNCNAVANGEVAGSFSADLLLPDGGLSTLTGIFTAVGCSP